MDTTLVTVTLLSLGMAAALSVIVWRMLRDEKQRSEARVAALAVMAARPVAPARLQTAPPPIAPVKATPATSIRSPAIVPASASATALFEEHVPESPWKNRLAVMTALGLALASVILFALAANTSKSRREPPPEARSERTPSTAAPATGLELISLRDSRQANALTITGLVRNPSQGAPLERIAVTAYTFDDKGSFLAQRTRADRRHRARARR